MSLASGSMSAPDGDSSWKGMLYLILVIGLIFGGALLGAKMDETAKKSLTNQNSVVESHHD